MAEEAKHAALTKLLQYSPDLIPELVKIAFGTAEPLRPKSNTQDQEELLRILTPENLGHAIAPNLSELGEKLVVSRVARKGRATKQQKEGDREDLKDVKVLNADLIWVCREGKIARYALSFEP